MFSPASSGSVHIAGRPAARASNSLRHSSAQRSPRPIRLGPIGLHTTFAPFAALLGDGAIQAGHIPVTTTVVSETGEGIAPIDLITPIGSNAERIPGSPLWDLDDCHLDKGSSETPSPANASPTAGPTTSPRDKSPTASSSAWTAPTTTRSRQAHHLARLTSGSPALSTKDVRLPVGRPKPRPRQRKPADVNLTHTSRPSGLVGASRDFLRAESGPPKLSPRWVEGLRREAPSKLERTPLTRQNVYPPPRLALAPKSWIVRSSQS